MSMISKFFGGLWSYLLAAGAFMALWLGYKYEKKKRKRVEKKLETANENVEILEKHQEIITDLDISREKDGDVEEMIAQQKEQIEDLKYEDHDNRDTTASLLGLLNPTKKD